MMVTLTLNGSLVETVICALADCHLLPYQHQAVGTHVVPKYRHFQSDEAIILLKDLVERPGAYVKCIERYAVSVASIIGWGRRIDRLDDYVAKQALAVMETIDYAVPGSNWTEAIPEMVHLPRWLHRFPHDLRLLGRMSAKYFCMLTREAADSRPDSGLARILVDRQEELQLADAEIANIAANVIGGGVDTTSSSLISFILAMCVFDNAQAAAHEELDRVVGHDRMPSPEDMPNLPYVVAMVKETLRWRTVTILAGIPHAPVVDDVYEGFTIPKGTPIVGNMWAIHRNPRDFVEPDRFKPERYLDGKLERPYPVARGHHAFGFGRRVCSGQPQAEQGLALVIAKLLWAFNIRPGVDAKVGEFSSTETWRTLLVVRTFFLFLTQLSITGTDSQPGYFRVHQRRKHAAAAIPCHFRAAVAQYQRHHLQRGDQGKAGVECVRWGDQVDSAGRDVNSANNNGCRCPRMRLCAIYCACAGQPEFELLHNHLRPWIFCLTFIKRSRVAISLCTSVCY